MTIFMNSMTKNFSFSYLNVLAPRKAWWVRIQTENPSYTYYFGPFKQKKEAELSQSGYVEDLFQEGAQIVRVCVEKSAPPELTVAE